MGIVHSLPQEWRLLLKALNMNSIPSRSATATNIQQLTSNKVYRSLITMKAKEPSAKVKFKESFPGECRISCLLYQTSGC